VRRRSISFRLPFLPVQAAIATRTNAGTTRTCCATAARLSRRPVLSPLARFCRGGSWELFDEAGKAGSQRRFLSPVQSLRLAGTMKTCRPLPQNVDRSQPAPAA
jgi:hypothetical protein